MMTQTSTECSQVKPADNMMEDGYFLSGEEMLAIRRREYHYNAWSSTILDPYLQPFWRWVVSKVPLHVAPSTLSVCGLACNVIATSITIVYAPNLTEILPSWVSIMNAISIFMYQTFDGIDGKQCHRTQEGELEEYTDHAVDSVSITLNAILLAAAMRLGDSPALLGANFLLALSAFYAAHWAAHTTHSLVFGRVDVSEAQWSMIAIHVATAFGDPGNWAEVILERPMVTMRGIVSMASAVTLFLGAVSNVSIASGLVETPLEENGIRIPRREVSSGPLGTYALIVGGLFLCIWTGLLVQLTVPVMLIVGLAMGKLGTRLILQKLITKDGTLLDECAFSPLLLAGLHALDSRSDKTQSSLAAIAWTLVLAVAADVLVFHMHATSDLKRARDVYVFSVRDEVGQKKSTGFYVAGGNVQPTLGAWQDFARDPKRVKAAYSCS